jgi:endo-1,4-beta-xylanase
MFKRNVTLGLALLTLSYCVSCKKKAEAPDEYLTTDTTGVLKNLAEFPVGVGVRLDPFKNDPAYLDLVQNNFNSITPENELKHASIVSNEGALDFTRPDEFINLAQAKGVSVFGHALVDWQSANTTYYRSLQAPGGTEVNAVFNPGFENGTGDTFTDWTTQVGPGATGAFLQETVAPYEGIRALKVNVTTAGPYQYSMQAYTPLFSLTQGNSYTLSFYAKAAVNGSRFKAVVQNNTYQEKTFFVTPGWAKYTWTFTANEPLASLKFHFPEAGTFWFDNISIPKSASGTIDPVQLDNAMKNYIMQTVSRYAGKINAWDVVNEPLDDETGKTRSNPQPGTLTGDKFYFAEFLGRDYIENALRYASAANSNATLYINEAKLESDPVKLDSMISLINQLKAKGVPLHGIGLQMHLTIKNDRKGIEIALQRLAATGLKIRISEMDVRVNPWNYFGYQPSNEDLVAQRDLYRFAMGAYYRLVPASQRAGITFWDPSDKYSWIMINQGKDDAPTLFDKNNAKKPAYYGAVVALRKKQ